MTVTMVAHTSSDIDHAPFGNALICIKRVFQLNRYKVVWAFLYQPPTLRPRTTKEACARTDVRFKSAAVVLGEHATSCRINKLNSLVIKSLQKVVLHVHCGASSSATTMENVRARV